MWTGIVQQQERVELIFSSVREEAADGKTIANPVLPNVLHDLFDCFHVSFPKTAPMQIVSADPWRQYVRMRELCCCVVNPGPDLFHDPGQFLQLGARERTAKLFVECQQRIVHTLEQLFGC